MRGNSGQLCSWIARLWHDRAAVAAIEFALSVSLLVVAFINVVDFGYYTYTRMEVENAAIMGAQAALRACSIDQLPATINCAGMSAAITSSIRSTSLGSNISLALGSPTEGYYCINGLNALQSVGTLDSKPADCSAAGTPALQPGDYIQVQVTYSYSSLFPALSAMGTLSITTITKTSWMRLG